MCSNTKYLLKLSLFTRIYKSKTNHCIDRKVLTLLLIEKSDL